MQKVHVLVSVLLCPLALCGCDSFRNTFGLDHYSPDAWTTEPSPGLILPPDFAHRPKLPPPRPGAPNPHIIPETTKAQKTVLGDKPTVEASSTVTQGEKDVLEQASENHTATPNIRQIVDEESQTDSTVSGKVISKIKSWNKEIRDNLTLSKPRKNNSDDDGKNEEKPDNS